MNANKLLYVPGIAMAIALLAGMVVAQHTQRLGKSGETSNRSVAPITSARPSQPVEVGVVRWQRDFDAALAKSRTSQKPVLVLFQEVPGCAGCQTFGKTVLSNPLLVEAIETEFVPVVVYNLSLIHI